MYVWGSRELGCWNEGNQQLVWFVQDFLHFSLMSLESLGPEKTGTVDHPGGNCSLDQSCVAPHRNFQGSSRG